MQIGITTSLTKFRDSGGVYDNYTIGGQRPTLILDFCNNVYASRPLGREDYKIDGTLPTLVLDFENNYYGG